MVDLAYVCLSDLHFGAENSLLTALTGDVADPSRPSEVLLALVECFRALIPRDTRSLPRLVLAGDILDLALSPDDAALRACDHFIRLAFEDGHRLFDPNILYVPGNHDHHLWETARERLYAEYLANRPVSQIIEAPWHTTRMFDAGPRTSSRHGTSAQLLETLIHRHRGLEDVRVWTVYPNLGIIDSASGRALAITHGHFIEPTYQLVTRVLDLAFPGVRRPGGPANAVVHLEEENFAWIDFVWSTLGRSGEFGTRYRLLYQLLQDRKALCRRADIFIDGATRQWTPGRFGKLGRFASALALRLAFRIVSRRAKNLERFPGPGGTATGDPLSKRSREGLQRYLEEGLLPQMEHELRKTLQVEPPRATSVVFGHTHKPFEEPWSTAKASGRFSLYNTGGWVVDTPWPATDHGAAIVVADRSLRTASIRMYNQVAGGHESVMPHIRSVDDDQTWAKDLTAELHGSPGPWQQFREVAAREVTHRQEVLRRILEAQEDS